MRGGLLLLALAALGCSQPGLRTVEDRVRGVRYDVPPGWLSFDGEIRSTEHSLLTLRVNELEGAERRFVAELPDSLLPQLEAWARDYFILDGPPSRREIQLGGEPAVELAYVTRARPGDTPSRLVYVVARHGTRLYVLRITYATQGRGRDEAAIEQVLASWRFLDPAPAAAEAPAPA